MMRKTRWTVNVQGKVAKAARVAGYHAYEGDNVTAIEIETYTQGEAIRIASQFGRVLYVFE